MARRYAVVFVGNVVDSSPKWGVAIHDTHNGLFAHNIVYKNAGSGVNACVKCCDITSFDWIYDIFSNHD
jgi:hypothetical protein